MILLRTKNPKERGRTRKSLKKQLRRLNSKTFRIQENSPKNKIEILLERNNQKHKEIHMKIHKMLTRKKLL